MGIHLDFNTLLLIISAFYFVLFVLTSDTVINRVFNIQQGLILIVKAFDNINTSFNNIHDVNNENIELYHNATGQVRYTEKKEF